MQQNLQYRAPNRMWGQAITHIEIDKEGKMWAHNEEYATQINYCPFTGTPAPTKMIVIDKEKYKAYINEQDQSK